MKWWIKWVVLALTSIVVIYFIDGAYEWNRAQYIYNTSKVTAEIAYTYNRTQNACMLGVCVVSLILGGSIIALILGIVEGSDKCR